jgi:NitT/TauT family transport system permease protein
MMAMELNASTTTDAGEISFERERKRRARRNVRQGLLGVFQPILAAICLLLLWQLIVVVFDVPKYIFPSPTDVIGKGIKNSPKIWYHYATTLRSAFLGYLLAVAVAVPSSLIIAYSTFAQKSVYPGLVLIHMTPKVTLAPLIIAWMGFGVAPKVTVTFLLCFMPIILNGILGFRSIDPEIIYLSRSTGVRNREMFWKIRLPSALPTLFTGLKHGASLAIIGAVVAEYIGGNRGLGYYLILSLDSLQMDVGMAIMVAMTTIGLAFFFGVSLLENVAIPWHVSKRRATRKSAP